MPSKTTGPHFLSTNIGMHYLSMREYETFAMQVWKFWDFANARLI